MNLPVILLGLTFFCAPAFAGEWTVKDGDTITNGPVTYRLHGIDAPEKAQTCLRDGVEWLCGQEAAAYLRSLVAAQMVTCEPKDRDRYGRTVAICRAAEIELNREMVRAGMAWAYTRYSADYLDAESEAREAGRGVWGSEAISPWEWRKAKR
jgi:endonuclease YncB( thermonuclease family)